MCNNSNLALQILAGVFVGLLCLCHAHSILCSASTSRPVGQFFEAPRKSVQLIVNIICSSIALSANSSRYPSFSLHQCLSIFCASPSSFSVGRLENSTCHTPPVFLWTHPILQYCCVVGPRRSGCNGRTRAHH